VAEKYFVLYAAKDLDGLISLWSANSPELEARKKSAAELFASSEKIALESFAVRQVSVAGDKARVRVEVDLQVIEAQTGKEKAGYGKMLRTLECVRGADGWKVVEELATYDELAGVLLSAKTDEELAALLAAETGLVTPELSRALGRSSDRLREAKQYAPALAAARLALKLAEQLNDRPGEGLAWERIGRASEGERDYRQALEDFQRGLALFEALGDKQMVSTLLGRIANCYYYLENYQAALEINLKRLKLTEELNDRQRIAVTLDNITASHYRLGNFQAALATGERAIEVYEELDDDGGVARMLILLGNVHFEQSDYAKVIENNQRAGAIFSKNGDAIGPGLSTLNIGEAYTKLGDYSRALEAYQKALAAFTEQKSLARMALASYDIGTIYSTLTDYDQARDYIQRSLLLYEQANRPLGRAEALNAIGNSYRREGNYARALDYLRQGLKLLEESGRKTGLAEGLTEMGDLYLEQGDRDLAFEFYQRSQTLFEELGSKDGVASTMKGIARVEQTRDDYAKALSIAEGAAALAGQTGNLELLWEINSVAGKSHLALKQTESARREFEWAVETIELLRAQAAGGELARPYFLERRLAPYHALVELMVGQGRPQEALVWAERSKARVLLDVLQSGRPNGWVDARRAMTSAEDQEERRLRAEIISLNTQVTGASQRDKPDQTRLGELKSLREKARLSYEAFQTSLYVAHPELRVQRGEAPVIKTEELAALLPDEHSALLEYVVTDDQTYLFTVTRAQSKPVAEVQVFTLPVKRADLAKQTEGFRGQLAARDLGFRASAHRLYDLLLRPAQSLLRGNSSLIIVPDDRLWELPFQALLGEGDRYVIETSAVAYAPSLTVLREMSAHRGRRPPEVASSALLALGNPVIGRETAERATLALRDEKLSPLPEAEQEVKALGQFYGPQRSKVYIGPQAREGRVKAEAGQARVLHFATHGILNNASPMYSHLVLAQGDKNEDGLLEAWELMQMDLKAELAVLSACETARGRFRAGEGMIGLSWALFVAGVPSTVVSQWTVESGSTRDLMLSFHRALKALSTTAKTEATKAEALRQASLKLMKNAETSHPFFWAGFVLVGESR
jgi:CHAT domain-containing protein